MILGIQYLSILVALVMTYYGFIQYKKKKVSYLELAIWEIIWLIFIIITLFPNVLDSITYGLSLERRIDVFIFGGFVVMVSVLFKNYLDIKASKLAINEIVTKIAIKRNEEERADKKKPKKKN